MEGWAGLVGRSNLRDAGKEVKDEVGFDKGLDRVA